MHMHPATRQGAINLKHVHIKSSLRELTSQRQVSRSDGGDPTSAAWLNRRLLVDPETNATAERLAMRRKVAISRTLGVACQAAQLIQTWCIEVPVGSGGVPCPQRVEVRRQFCRWRRSGGDRIIEVAWRKRFTRRNQALHWRCACDSPTGLETGGLGHRPFGHRSGETLCRIDPKSFAAGYSRQDGESVCIGVVDKRLT